MRHPRQRSIRIYQSFYHESVRTQDTGNAGTLDRRHGQAAAGRGLSARRIRTTMDEGTSSQCPDTHDEQIRKKERERKER
jgi:hypothetical protein